MFDLAPLEHLAHLLDKATVGSSEVAVVENGNIGERGRVKGKVPQVRADETGAHPWLRVVLVLRVDKLRLGVEDLGDVEPAASVVEHAITVDGQVAGVPGVLVVDDESHDCADEDTAELVHNGECGNGKRDKPNFRSAILIRP